MNVMLKVFLNNNNNDNNNNNNNNNNTFFHIYIYNIINCTFFFF